MFFSTFFIFFSDVWVAILFSPIVWAATLNPIFCNCLTNVVLCLLSLLLFINNLHSSMSLSSKQVFSCSIHVSICIFNMLIMFTDLILSLSNAFSALFTMYSPLGVLTFVFNLMLTGMMSCFRHLSKNLLWFMKLAILHSNFSHHQSNFTFSIPYSEVI